MTLNSTLYDDSPFESGDERECEAEKPASEETASFVKSIGLPGKSTFLPYVDDASGLPVDADAPSRRRAPNTIASALGLLLPRLGAESVEVGEPQFEEVVLAAWNDVVDDELREKLTPEKYVDKVLYVKARNSSELFEIRRFKLRPLEARAKRHAVFAGLRQIRVRL